MRPPLARMRQLLEKEGGRIDSVNVAVPDHMHAAVSMVAMRALAEWFDGEFYPPEEIQQIHEGKGYPPESAMVVGTEGSLLRRTYRDGWAVEGL